MSKSKKTKKSKKIKKIKSFLTSINARKKRLSPVEMKEATAYNKKVAKNFKAMLPSNSIPQLNADSPGKNRQGSVNVSSGSNVGLDIYLMCCFILGVETLRGVGFFEVGMGDGLVSQFLSRACGVVSIGCESSVSSFLRWKTSHQKMLQLSDNKLIPVCYYGDFCKMRSYAGATIAYGWCEGAGSDVESRMLDVFNVDPICKTLITNWLAPSEFPEWHKDEDGECNFELIGTFRNYSRTAQRTMHVHAKKNLQHKRVRKYDFWTNDDDELGRVMRKTRMELNKIRNNKCTHAKCTFFKDIEGDLGGVRQDPKQLRMPWQMDAWQINGALSGVRLTRSTLNECEAGQG